jgi:transposase
MKKLTRRPTRFKGITVGLDVHQQFVVYQVLDRKGDDEAGGRFVADHTGLEDLLTLVGRRKVQYVLEASSCFLWLYDALAERVGTENVHVAQPHRVRPIAASLEKNDANDAWWLAYLCFEGRLPEAYVPQGAIRELRIATRELRSAVNRRADLIRRLRSHLVQMGLRLKTKNLHTEEGRAAAWSRLELLEGMRRVAVERILRSVEAGDEEVEGWRRLADELCKGLPLVQTLSKEIDGLGPVTASIIYAELGDPRRFHSAKAFAKATGLVPGLRESAGRRAPIGISRAGSASARWAFTRAVIACMRCKGGAGRNVKYWVLRRSGSRPKRKVIVAAARKMAEGVWRLFALGEEFDLARAFPGKTAA